MSAIFSHVKLHFVFSTRTRANSVSSSMKFNQIAPIVYDELQKCAGIFGIRLPPDSFAAFNRSVWTRIYETPPFVFYHPDQHH